METALNKLTVVGKMDPTKLRDNLSQKIKKHVEIVPPIPKKEKDGGGSSREDFDKKDGNGGGSANGQKKGGGGDGGQEEGGGGGENRTDVFGHPWFGYFNNGYGYGDGFVNGYRHAKGRKRRKEKDCGSSRGDDDKKDGNGGGNGGGKKKGGGGYYDHGYGFGNGFVSPLPPRDKKPKKVCIYIY